LRTSIYDVAKRAGVSVVTVSRVLNHATSVRETSRSKVMEAVEHLNYQPSAAARSLASGKTNLIGLIVPNISDPFLSEVIYHVDQALEDEGLSLVVTIIGELDQEQRLKKYTFFKQERVDAVMVLTPLFEEDYIDHLKRSKIPFVIMDNQRYPFQVPSVVIDNYKGGYDATTLLLDSGHEKIAYIGGPSVLLSAEDRFAGYLRALGERGLNPYCVYRGSFEIETGYGAVKDMIEKHTIPTAVFAGDDHIAFGVIDAFRQVGLKIPEDISLVGYDNHPFCNKLHPKLTSVAQPAARMAREAVDLLLSHMKGELGSKKVIKLEPTLVVRESVKFVE
jgi:LacI family transcriptional regulator